VQTCPRAGRWARPGPGRVVARARRERSCLLNGISTAETAHASTASGLGRAPVVDPAHRRAPCRSTGGQPARVTGGITPWAADAVIGVTSGNPERPGTKPGERSNGHALTVNQRPARTNLNTPLGGRRPAAAGGPGHQRTRWTAGVGEPGRPPGTYKPCSTTIPRAVGLFLSGAAGTLLFGQPSPSARAARLSLNNTKPGRHPPTASRNTTAAINLNGGTPELRGKHPRARGHRGRGQPSRWTGPATRPIQVNQGSASLLTQIHRPPALARNTGGHPQRQQQTPNPRRQPAPGSCFLWRGGRVTVRQQRRPYLALRHRHRQRLRHPTTPSPG